MNRGRRDIIVITLAVAGVIGALSLAGIFIVYLVDTIGGDDSTSAKPAGTTGPPGLVVPPVTGATGPSGPAENPQGTNGEQPPADGSGGANPKLNRIPDNQVYETYRNSGGGYSILYPKGWNKEEDGDGVTFSVGLNSEHVGVANGPAPTTKSVREAIAANKKLVIVTPPRMINLNGQRVVKSTVRVLGVRRESGAVVRAFIDRYDFGRGRKIAVLELSTTGAVRTPNADDFNKIAQSFRWT